MNKVLITGGAGFIGSHIVHATLKQGDSVRVLDNLSSGKRAYLAHLDVEFIEGDLRSLKHVERAVQGVDIIYHQAALVSVPQSMEEPQYCFDVNVLGTFHLLEAAKNAGVQRVVIASSSAVYGDSSHIPLAEEEILKPLSPYAVSKQVTEVYAGLYTRTLGLPVVALRYFNVYGPRQSIDSAYAAVIPIFIRRLLDNKEPIIYGDGRQIRDFIYVEEVVRANILAAQAPQAPGYAFNICSGQETNLLDLLKAMKAVLTAHEGNLPAPRFAAPRIGDIYRSVGDPTLAQKNLEFRAQISLEEGLTRTAASI